MTPHSVERTDRRGDTGGRHSNIEIDGRHFRIEEEELTGGALKSLGGIPADYQLFLEVPGRAPDRGVRDDEIVRLKSGQKFYGVVSGTLG